MFDQILSTTAALRPLAPELLWILILAFVIAFLLAFSVGANDVSNSFGTSVGSKVLTVTQACILATFFEVAGATLLGYSVCDTFRRNMYDIQLYKDSQKELMLGALACLIGSSAWNLIATALKMPISGTHSIVGATIGFSIVLRGWSSIKWTQILRIVASWFASPLIAGLISSLIYLLISKTVISKLEPLKYGLKALPLFYGATIFINTASIFIDGPDVMGLNQLPWYTGLFISLLIAVVAICFVALKLVPKLRDQIGKELLDLSAASGKTPTVRGSIPLTQVGSTKASFDNAAFKPDKPVEVQAGAKRALAPVPSELPEAKAEAGTTPRQAPPAIAPKPSYLLRRQQALNENQQMDEINLKADDRTQKHDVESNERNARGPRAGNRPEMISGERLDVFRLFSSLQILTACFASFAHGTNDVSNAVAPLIPIWNIYAFGEEDISKQTQVWILLFGGIGICTGLWAWGRAVMSTVGDGLTKLTPSKGFSIELGAAISVLTATKLGMPISTTHCKVGSVVIVGLVSSKFCSRDNFAGCETSQGAGEEAEKEQAVDWKLFGNIAITWIVTVPLAASASALVMLIFKWFIL